MKLDKLLKLDLTKVNMFDQYDKILEEWQEFKSEMESETCDVDLIIAEALDVMQSIKGMMEILERMFEMDIDMYIDVHNRKLEMYEETKGYTLLN